jgi:geranylgeranyl diphosphate synthase type I
MPRPDDDTLVNQQTQLEARLRQFAETELREATRHARVPRLHQAASGYVTRPSRRLLGMAFLHAAGALGLPGRYRPDDLVAVATALEVRHAAILLHDDIVDGDTVRGGLPTAHHALAEEFGPGEAASAALFAGDALAAIAPLPLLRSGLPAEVRLRAAARFQHRTALVATGQARQLHLDVTAPLPELTEADVLAAHASQFVPYLMLSLELAGLLAGLDAAALAAISDAGTPLCAAFQVQNDVAGHDELVRVLGADGGTAAAPTVANTSDLGRRRRTTVIRAALDGLDTHDRARLTAYAHGAPADLRDILALVDSTPAVAHCRALVALLHDRAAERLTAAEALPPEAHAALTATWAYMRALYDPRTTTAHLYLRARPDLHP